jgi:protein phosphatase
MKILAISDLHANWPALEAVIAAESFDRLLVGGDLVSYGPHPREVVDFVRLHATVAVRGNHDEALAHGADCRCAPSSKPLAEATRAVHRTLLAREDAELLGALPLTATFTEAGHSFFCVHASPLEHLYRYTLTPEAPDDHFRHEIAPVQEEYVLLGHTHFPMIRRIGAQFVINPGSVGQPRDGDPRASYAVIEDGVVTLKRAAYDVERTILDLRALGLDGDITDRLIVILKNGR